MRARPPNWRPGTSVWPPIMRRTLRLKAAHPAQRGAPRCVGMIQVALKFRIVEYVIDSVEVCRLSCSMWTMCHTHLILSSVTYFSSTSYVVSEGILQTLYSVKKGKRSAIRSIRIRTSSPLLRSCAGNSVLPRRSCGIRFNHCFAVKWRRPSEQSR